MGMTALLTPCAPLWPPGYVMKQVGTRKPFTTLRPDQCFSEDCVIRLQALSVYTATLPVRPGAAARFVFSCHCQQRCQFSAENWSRDEARTNFSLLCVSGAWSVGWKSLSSCSAVGMKSMVRASVFTQSLEASSRVPHRPERQVHPPITHSAVKRWNIWVEFGSHTLDVPTVFTQQPTSGSLMSTLCLKVYWAVIKATSELQQVNSPSLWSHGPDVTCHRCVCVCSCVSTRPSVVFTFRLFERHIRGTTSPQSSVLTARHESMLRKTSTWRSSAHVRSVIVSSLLMMKLRWSSFC